MHKIFSQSVFICSVKDAAQIWGLICSGFSEKYWIRLSGQSDQTSLATTVISVTTAQSESANILATRSPILSQACDMLHVILRQEQVYFDARSSGEATEEMIRQVNASYEALYDFCLEELGSRLGPFFYDHIADRAHMIYPSWCLWIRNNVMSHVFRREDSPID
ncbi:hypothetical protein FRC02_005732, partial [Tulasnella sp. 418]